MHRYLLKYTLLLLIFSTTIFSAETESSKLGKITFSGIAESQQRALLTYLPFSTGDEYSDKDVQWAIKQLYKSGRFDNVKVFSTDNNGIHFELEETPYLDAIEYKGNKKIKQSTLEELNTINRGERISDVKIYKNITAMRVAYHEKGYLNAKIECKLVETSIDGYVIAVFHIKEGKKIRVQEINFSGNSAFSEKKLGRKFKTKERHLFSSGEFDEELYQRHLDTLISAYTEAGYMDAHIVSDSFKIADDTSAIVIDVKIEEGKQYIVGDFYFKDNTIIPTNRLSAAVVMRKDKPFKKSKYQMTQQLVGNEYRNEGYLWSNIEPQYKYRGDTVDVIFTITEGRPAIVRKIGISGNEKTREQVIRRELRIYPGQKYNQSLMERSIRDVRQLNYFDNITPDIAPNQDGTIDLVFNVKEKDNIGQFSAGVTYSAQNKFGGNFSVSIPNFRGAGEKLDATVELSKGRQKYSLGFIEPWIFNTPTSFSSRLFYERIHHEEDDINSRYNYQRVGTEFGLGRRLKWPDDYFSGSVRYMLSYDQYDNARYGQAIEDNLGINIVNHGVLGRLYLGLTRNDTDYPQFPTKGSVFHIGSYFGGLGNGGEPDSNATSTRDREAYNYVKGTVSYDWFQPLFWKFVLGAKTKIGLISSIHGQPSLGYSDLFQVGGVYYDGVVRGYDDASLGIDLAMLTLSAEIRVPIIDQQFYLGVFGDMGNSFNKPKEIDIMDLKRGAGFGFRLMLPMVGLLGFDFAWGLDDVNPPLFYEYSGGNGFKLHFIMNRGF